MDTAGSGGLYSYDENGEKRTGFPRWEAGEFDCGVAIDSQGNPWMADYNSSSVKQYTPNGVPTGRLISTAQQGPPCRVAFDKSTDDLYMVPYFSAALYRYTAASNYTKVEVVNGNGIFFQLAVDSSTHIIYAGGFFGVGVVAYQPNGEIIETFDTGIELGALAVDESTHDVYVGNEETGEIEVWPAVVVPDATTGEQTGFATVNGHVDPAGGGNVTECFFQYGQTSEGPPNFSSSIPCDPAVPPDITAPTDVTADLSGVVTPETKYDYRLVAGNAKGRTYGERKIFTPHFVSALRTEAATGVTREGATLHGSFEGTGEDTEFQFEWGREAGTYEEQTGLEDIGTTTGPTPLAFTIPEGELEPTDDLPLPGRRDQLERRKPRRRRRIHHGTRGHRPDHRSGHRSDQRLGGTARRPSPATASTTKYFFEYGTNALRANDPGRERGLADRPDEPRPATIEGLRPAQPTTTGSSPKTASAARSGRTGNSRRSARRSIIALSTSHVSATEAELHATINPEGETPNTTSNTGRRPPTGPTSPVPDGVIPASLDRGKSGPPDRPERRRLPLPRRRQERQSANRSPGDQTFNFYSPELPELDGPPADRRQLAARLPRLRAGHSRRRRDHDRSTRRTVPFSPTATSPRGSPSSAPSA